MSSLRQTESRLLSVYQKVNPSTYRIETDEAEFRNRESFFSGLLNRRLYFPKRMFRDADLIEFGSGTGEHSLFYLLWGARGTFVEINPKAIERMTGLFEHFGIPENQYRSINQSIFDFEPERTWDIVATLGVLHHLEDKEAAFSRVASCVAPGGYLIFGIANSAGSVQRNLQRLIVHRLAGTDHQAIEEIAERLFSEHLDRAERFGRRTRQAIIYDTYVNPKIDSMSVSEVLALFDANGLEPWSIWPPVMPALLGDSPNRPGLNPADWPSLNALAELGWMAHRDDDKDLLAPLEKQIQKPMRTVSDLANVFNDQHTEQQREIAELQEAARSALNALPGLINPYDAINQQASKLLSEIVDVLALVEAEDLAALEQRLSRCEVLFRGTSGLGMSYYIAHRPEDEAGSD